MDIEEGEVIFGKRWNQWTDEEWLEFLGCVTPKQLGVPAILSRVVDLLNQNRGDKLPSDVQADAMDLMLSI